MPRLATTLKDIAEHGDDSFHNGSFTDDLVTDLREIGSIITRDDLQGYTVQEKQPVEITLKCGTRVISPPAPGGGPVLSLILNILDGYGLTKNDIDSVENRTRTCHRFIETLKMAYQECHQHCNDGKPLEEIISEDVANHLRSSINDKQIVELIKESANVKRRSACTSHVSVLDKNGLAVSVTSTINSRFGSGLVGKKTGIIFNNEMDDFSHPGQKGGMYSSPVNYVASGNRPLSSMCPAILVDSRGKVTYILGAAGGSMITSTVAWIAAHFLWFEKDLDQAVSMPRLHFDYATATVQYEEKFEKVIIDNLKKMGHILKVFHPGASISQGIEVKGQMIHAKSDQRKGGQPDGI
ncbi:hypothetical protein Btru_021104 [Bulinus truncatus]|nr:hypothetical protein Btru_021104 [Bulinus truncatus]